MTLTHLDEYALSSPPDLRQAQSAMSAHGVAKRTEGRGAQAEGSQLRAIIEMGIAAAYKKQCMNFIAIENSELRHDKFKSGLNPDGTIFIVE